MLSWWFFQRIAIFVYKSLILWRAQAYFLSFLQVQFMFVDLKIPIRLVCDEKDFDSNYS